MFDSLLGSTQDCYVFYGRDTMILITDVMDGYACEQFAEINETVLFVSVIRFAFNEVGASNDIIESFHTNFCQILSYLLCQECEEVDQIFASSVEAFA